MSEHVEHGGGPGSAAAIARFMAGGSLGREVLAAAHGVPLTFREDETGAHLTCAADTQSVIRLSTLKGPYTLRIREISTAVVAHMIQVHGWSRERAVPSDQEHAGG